MHTGPIENFFSHTLLRYNPKRIRFSYDIYVARCQLAVLDYNFHLGRDVQQTQYGDVYINCYVSKRSKEWVAYLKLQEKTYGYITGTFNIYLFENDKQNFMNPMHL